MGHCAQQVRTEGQGLYALFFQGGSEGFRRKVGVVDPNEHNIGEDLFNLENQELQWFIGRQDQYSIVFGGFNCFEFGQDYARPQNLDISQEVLEKFRTKLLLLHTSE